MVQANMNLWHNLYGKILDSPEVAEIFFARYERVKTLPSKTGKGGKPFW